MSLYRLRFFFDYGSGVCFWAANEAARQRFDYPVAMEQLPLSAALQASLEELIKTYDQSLDWNDPAGPGLWNHSGWHNLNTAVEQTLAAVRAELGSGFEIVDEYHGSNGAT